MVELVSKAEKRKFLDSLASTLHVELRMSTIGIAEEIVIGAPERKSGLPIYDTTIVQGPFRHRKGLRTDLRRIQLEDSTTNQGRYEDQRSCF
jgi:hypothetical protein